MADYGQRQEETGRSPHACAQPAVQERCGSAVATLGLFDRSASPWQRSLRTPRPHPPAQTPLDDFDRERDPNVTSCACGMKTEKRATRGPGAERRK